MGSTIMLKKTPIWLKLMLRFPWQVIPWLQTLLVNMNLLIPTVMVFAIMHRMGVIHGTVPDL